MELIIIPNKYKTNINSDIKNKFSDISDEIEGVIWEGNIKPSTSGLESTITEELRYEEIQFLQVKLKNREQIYEIGDCIYSQIKYPCVIEFLINNAVIIGVCKFKAGKKDFSANVERKMFFSHILRKELLSEKAQKMVNDINTKINSSNSIGDMYSSICNAVINYPLSGTSKAHIDRLITDMLGKVSTKEKDNIRKYCEPYKYYSTIFGNNRFNRRKSTSYTLIHDYEEVWYCFMKHPSIKEIIEKRKYRDIEDLIYSIDSKEW